MLVMLEQAAATTTCPAVSCAPSDLAGALDQAHQAGVEDPRLRRKDGNPVRAERRHRLPLGRAGQVEPGSEDAAPGRELSLALTLADGKTMSSRSHFRISAASAPTHFTATDHDDVLLRNVPVRRSAHRWTARRGRHGVRPPVPPITASTAASAAARSQRLRRRRALHAGLGRAHHRRAARTHHRRGARSSPRMPRRPMASRW